MADQERRISLSSLLELLLRAADVFFLPLLGVFFTFLALRVDFGGVEGGWTSSDLKVARGRP